MQVVTHKDLRTIAVVGDIHLGRGDGRTGFGGDIDALVRNLSALAERVDLLVINGDLYDLDRGTFPLRFRSELRTVRQRWPEIEPLLSRPDVLLLAGNHDAILVDEGLAAHALDIPARSLRLRVEHGERFDAWVKRWRSFTSLVTWCSGVASRAGRGSIYNALRGMERLAVGDEDAGQLARAERWLEEAPCDVLVFGHTHVRHAGHSSAGWLLNPGASMGDATRWLTVDLHRAEVVFGESDAQGRASVVDRYELLPHDPAEKSVS